MSKVYVIDSYSYKHLHEMFNACFALILDRTFDEVQYYAGEEQIGAIKRLSKQYNYKFGENFSFHQISVVKKNGKIDFLIRYLLSVLQNIRFLFITPRKAILIYSATNPFSLSLIKLFNTLLRKKIIFVCHGELKYLQQTNNKKSTWEKIIISFYRVGIYTFLSSKNIYYLVLGDIIKANMQQYKIPALQILVMDHPYFFDVSLVKREPHIDTDKQFQIGSVGVFTPVKGALDFLNIAHYFETDENVMFHVIGRIQGLNESQVLQSYSNVVFHAKDNTYLNRTKFDESVKQLDYILMLYEQGGYQLVVSGAIFDAISYNIPIIAKENDYFKYLFEKHGKLGYLCKDLNSIQEIIKTISSLEQIDNFQDAINNAKQYHSVDNIALLLAKELKEFRFLN
ncbi:hypothetical protein FACS189416_2120 [Bacteroidia bacterium]|nr:hypothetical protein FACS189416_2120 [Bacteroidia bacterium]